MKESIGSTFLYNMIFVFIIVVFGLLTATLSYYKGYKVNSRILKTIKDNSGYNENSYKEIERILNGIGYTVEGNNAQSQCKNDKKGFQLIKAPEATKSGMNNTSYLYCVYYNPDDTSQKEKDNGKQYYSYAVRTYIYIDLPIVNKIKIPVYTKGERIYKFSGSCQRGADC